MRRLSLFKSGLIAFFVLSIALLISGCGGGGTIGGQGGGSQAGSTFTFGRGGDSVGLDPINVTDGESLYVTRQIYDGLLGFKPSSTDVFPALAAEIPKPENGGRQYTFKLRQGVKFHDGTPFNADAVVFNFDRWRDTKNPYHKGGGGQSANFAYYKSMFGGFDDKSVIEKVEAIGPYEVRFTLKNPQGPFLKNVAMSAFGIASPEAIKKDVDNFWRHPVGTGPFKFGSWNQGTEVRVVKNPDWWGTKVPEAEGGSGPFVDTVVFRAIPDNTARVAALAGNQLSGATGLTPGDVPSVEKNPNLKVQFRPPLNVGYLAMNNQKKPFDDPRVRQAVNMSINMPALVKAFFGDTGEVASNPMPPTVPFFDKSIQPYPYDQNKAKELLAQAGYPNGFDTELWYMPIPRPYMPDGKGIAQAMQADLEKVGIKTKLVTFDWGTYLQKVQQGDHTMALLGWTGDNGDPDNFLNVLLSSTTATPKNANNIAYYKNPEVDNLLTQAQQTTDENQRRDLYYKAQQIIHQDAPWVPIAYAKPPLGFQKQVQGYNPSPTGGEPFNSVRLSGGGS